MAEQPKTVRGWLETLPEPHRESAWHQITSGGEPCKSLGDALSILSDECPAGHRLFWDGFRDYVLGRKPAERTKHGYNAAKAAYETKVVPQTKENMFGCFAKRQETASTNGKEYGVEEICENSKGITPDQSAILKTAIDKWGAESQTEMAVEECSELILAIQKVKRVGGREIKPEAITNLIDEIADVEIMMHQMRLIYGSDAVDERIKFKINRLKGRLEK